MIIKLKGSSSSGWYGPPRGTHSGEKHRSVGSGKASKSKPVVKKPTASLPTVSTLSQIEVETSGAFGKVQAYWIMPDGELHDVNASGVPEDWDTSGQHWGSLIAYPEAFGLDKRLIDDLSGLDRTSFSAGVSDWSDKALAAATRNGAVRVGSSVWANGKGEIYIEGLPNSRAGIRRMQDMILVNKNVPDRKGVEYIWDPIGTTNSYTFSWAELMAANDTRDLKDETLKISSKIFLRLRYA